ncbi:unnamed protein product [Blepharisma stoltei]|uniref:Uncharacterized protein n=1 Tax=Blepharisma stoltei TaxID=1481888 RepID=A0AAU9INH1_9CILI|nr:unnamed protein product [Blepharisma stoltei]
MPQIFSVPETLLGITIFETKHPVRAIIPWYFLETFINKEKYNILNLVRHFIWWQEIVICMDYFLKIFLIFKMDVLEEFKLNF